MPVRVESVPPHYALKLAYRIAGLAVPQEGGDCWLWTGRISRKGYGHMKVLRRVIGAHRAAWMAYRGDIPEGLVIDHLCRNRACVNPWHLEPVTVQVNTQRGDLAGVVGRHRGVACLRGHVFSEHGVERRSRDGYTRQICRLCERIRNQARRST